MMKRVSVVRTHFWRFILLSVAILGGMFSSSPAETARAAIFTVNMTTDGYDAGGSRDGVCDTDIGTSGLQCTIRAAIEEANANAGADTIIFDSSTNGTSIELTISGSGEAFSRRGDLDIYGDLTITGNGASSTVIMANFASDPDRVIQIHDGATVILNDITIRGGERPTGTDVGVAGAGILNGGTTTLNRVRVTDNTSGYRGGGIQNGGIGTSPSMTINDSLIDANTSGSSGGGIFAEVAVTINNTTFSGNIASAGSGGGAAVIGGTMALNFVTVTQNTASSDGGGIHQFGGTLNVRNSIIFGNNVGAGTDNCGGTIVSLDYNVAGADCGFSGGQDTSSDPLLGALADNGGPTFTHALSTISPAVDLIPSNTNECGTTYTTDQRGITRPIDGDGDSSGQCDVGALESLQACPTSVAYDTNYVVGDVTFHIPSGTGNTGNIDCFLVSPYQKNHPNATVPLQTGEYWQLGVFDNSGVAATGYNLSLTISNLSFTADDDDKLCRWDNPGWSCGEDTDNTPSGTSITRTGVTALSPWTAGNNASPTALQLQDLTVRPTSSTTHLALALIALIGLAAGVYLIRSRR